MKDSKQGPGRFVKRPLEPPKYALESYHAGDAPSDRRHKMHGEFNTAREALDAARHLIDGQLRGGVAAGRTAEDAFELWASSGLVPVIVAIHTSAQQVEFDPFAYAAPRAQLIAQGVT